MTFVSILLLILRGFGQYERRAVMQAVGGNPSGVKKLVRRIVIGTAVFEILGAALLSIRFIPDYGTGQGIWYSFFHSISAFCNAGFDLFAGTELGTGSLSHYAGDPLVSLTICALIIVGGLGFCIWGDVLDCRLRFKKFQFYTKAILIVNTLLLAVGTLLYMLFEWESAYAGMDFGEKLLAAFFSSTTARTAGFYTVDPITMSDSGYLLTVILMFIGGSSGSTAGGIKVGTFTVIVMGMVAAFRSSRDLNIGNRRVDTKLLYQALGIFVAYLFLILTATMIICAIEPDGPNTFAQTLFEAASALGTVGLSMGYTATLSWASKLVLITLMYAGRAGVLTLVFALSKKRDSAEIRRPIDSFFIG